MTRYQVSTNFYLDEFVPPIIHGKYLHNSKWYIDPRVIDIAQFLRERFGYAIAVNNWAIEGKDFTGMVFSESGFRLPNSNTGASYSQHKLGKAGDIKFNHGKATREQALEFYNEIREDIAKQWHSLYKPLGLTTIEKDTPTWLHIDCRWTEFNHLFVVNYR